MENKYEPIRVKSNKSYSSAFQESRMKELENRVAKLEEMEERRQRNLQSMVQKQLENEKERERLKSTFQ